MASVNSSSRSADKSPREKGLLLSPFIASFDTGAVIGPLPALVKCWWTSWGRKKMDPTANAAGSSERT